MMNVNVSQFRSVLNMLLANDLPISSMCFFLGTFLRTLAFANGTPSGAQLIVLPRMGATPKSARVQRLLAPALELPLHKITEIL